MDEAEAEAEVEAPTHRRPPFVDVKCENSGMTRHFAIGTDAGFAVSIINSKLGSLDSALYIEAVKDGEERITFGPTSLLVDFGPGWTLHTVTELTFSDGEGGVVWPKPMQVPPVMGSDNFHGAKRAPNQAINFVYVGKILLAFILIFVLGAMLTLVLENVPAILTLVLKNVPN